eukprot:Selendium_serpulae@DN6426_c3_g2_i1.p1
MSSFSGVTRGFAGKAVCIAVAAVGVNLYLQYRRRKEKENESLIAVCTELRGSSLLSVDALSKAQIKAYVQVAKRCETAMRKAEGATHCGVMGLDCLKVLQGKCLAILFYEPSTRTSCSFEVAMKRLGGSTLRDDPTAISANMDGESVCDTIKMMSNSCDAIVIRHPSPQSAQEAANASALPVLNGDYPSYLPATFCSFRAHERILITGVTMIILKLADLYFAFYEIYVSTQREDGKSKMSILLWY